ncbi:MAG: DMT family transporter [Spirochaetes bacterium]|nr:DMT family transporter [Spirochaetota bacterium]
MERIGELAAFGTAVCWTVSAVFFEKASRKVGPFAVNFYKVVIALVLLTATALFARGMPLPVDAPPRAWFFLSLSGIVGFVIADIFLFGAYAMIGSRMTTLFLALSAPFTALIGFLAMGEIMPVRGLVAMAVVLTGIALAILGKGDAKMLASGDATMIKGYAWAILASLGQSGGMILTKLGLGDYNPIAGTQIRLMIAIPGFAVMSLLAGQVRRVFVDAPRDGAAVRATFVGAVFGPSIGVCLSLFALQRTLAGTASTLIGLTPVMIIAPSVLFLKQKVTALEIAGAVLAVAGAAVFFL